MQRNIIRLARNVYRYRTLLLFLVPIAALGLVFAGFLRMLLVLTLLTVLNLASSILSKHIPRASTSIELIMLSTVTTSLAYGGKVGSLFGMFSCVMYYFGTGRFSYFVTVFVPLYGLVGLAVPMLQGLPLLALGMIATLTYTFFAASLVYMLFSAKIDKIIAFAIINTIFNYAAFIVLAPIILTLMGY